MLLDTPSFDFVVALTTVGMLVASAVAAYHKSYPWFVACWSLFTAGYGLASWTFLVQDVFPLAPGASVVGVASITLAVAFYVMFLTVATLFGIGVSRYTLFWYVFAYSVVVGMVLCVIDAVLFPFSESGIPWLGLSGMSGS